MALADFQLEEFKHILRSDALHGLPGLAGQAESLENVFEFY